MSTIPSEIGSFPYFIIHNIILGSFNSFFQLDHQIDTSVYVIDNTAL